MRSLLHHILLTTEANPCEVTLHPQQLRLLLTVFTAVVYMLGLASMLVYATYVSAHSPTLGFSHTVDQ